ncbi:arsenate reductase (glutaredoxin) [Pseudoxanthomonas sp. UTMC 1351]|uniref:arsenate reductase (glutaredoxin) n=1 Tax=Pseudoxanthomonas sp. UTMC 1351 TaxID=2695853 RepID=UPI0034CE5796
MGGTILVKQINLVPVDGTLLYHNPCRSKSRGALQLLAESGIERTVVPYLDRPLHADQLRALLQQLDLCAHDLLRPGEPEYAELGLADPAHSEDQLIAALVEHPRLMERAIFVHGGRAVIGRPPERVLELQ